MDPESLLQQANVASQNVAGAIEKLPTALETFRQNLNQVYNKDNPLIQQRESFLKDYLSAGDTARAQLLPQHAGGIIFSPTELQALTSQRQAGALAPLSSLNQLIMGQYGSLKDYVSLGSQQAQALVQAAQLRAQQLMAMYTAAADQRYREQQLALERQKLSSPSYTVATADKAVYVIDPRTGGLISTYGTPGGTGTSGGIVIGGGTTGGTSGGWIPSSPAPSPKRGGTSYYYGGFGLG